MKGSDIASAILFLIYIIALLLAVSSTGPH